MLTTTNGGPSWRPAGATWTIGTEGIGWVLYVPDGTDESVTVRSDDQKPPAEVDATRIWDGIVDDRGQALDITVEIVIAESGSDVTLEMTVDNRSGRQVASALFPHVHGIDVPADRTLTALTRDYYGAKERPLWPRFEWTKGYYGTIRPTAMTDSLVFGNPTAPFVVMRDGTEALAAWVVGPTPEIVGWMWDLAPGYSDTIGDRVPADGQVRFSAVHLLDLASGERRAVPAVCLAHRVGDWPEALAGYRRHRASVTERTPAAPAPGWATRPHSWYQVGLNTAVGDRRYRFADLPEMARDCVASGVDVLHVIGWNDGGQDRNNPSHQPDPALGGADALRAAIAECQALGVRVVLFAKFTWADLATERFRNELHASAVRDPYGDIYRLPGYQYLTPHQLMDVSTRRLVPMCFLHEDYLRVCEQEFDTLVATGADGMLFDEAMHHTPALKCYATNHEHPAGSSVYANDNELARRLRQRVPADREFLFAAETVYEDLQPSYQVSYIRSHYVDHAPLTRYVNPGLRMLTTVSGFDDRNQINQALLYGYLLCYEPFHFKGRLTDMPATVGYGQRVDRLRADLAGYLWDGTFERAGELPAAPTALRTARWRHRDGSSTLLAVANYNDDPATVEAAGLGFTEQRGLDDDWAPASGPVSIAGRGLLLLR